MLYNILLYIILYLIMYDYVHHSKMAVAFLCFGKQNNIMKHAKNNK